MERFWTKLKTTLGFQPPVSSNRMNHQSPKKLNFPKRMKYPSTP